MKTLALLLLLASQSGLRSTTLCTGSNPADCLPPPPICGNGIVHRIEACDDGNRIDNDGCSMMCGLEAGYACTGSPSSCGPDCGDSLIIGLETCDDGNEVAADGCSDSCAVESGWYCTGLPSACTTTCGDGTKAGAEECDDGNLVDGDGCSATCTSEAKPLGYWSGFNVSNYFVTPTTDDLFDTAIMNGAFTLCIGFRIATAPATAQYLLGNGGLIDKSRGFTAMLYKDEDPYRLGAGIDLGSYPVYSMPYSTGNVPNAVCVGLSGSDVISKVNSQTTRSVGWGSLLETATTVATSIGKTNYPTNYPTDYRYADTAQIGAVFLSHTSPSDVFMQAKINEFLAGASFTVEAGTKILCNGAELGDVCTVGGTAFNKMGTPTFTAL